MVKSSEFDVPASLRLSLHVNDNETLLKNKLRTLLVDGCEVSQVMLSARLRSFGVETKCLESGLVTINCLVSGETYDLIFIAMPLSDRLGPELTRQIRAIGFKYKIFGIAYSGDQRDRAAFLATGVDGLLETPLDPSRLRAILEEVDNQI